MTWQGSLPGNSFVLKVVPRTSVPVFGSSARVSSTRAEGRFVKGMPQSMKA